VDPLPETRKLGALFIFDLPAGRDSFLHVQKKAAALWNPPLAVIFRQQVSLLI